MRAQDALPEVRALVSRVVAIEFELGILWADVER
jgi:hypothetical protein